MQSPPPQPNTDILKAEWLKLKLHNAQSQPQDSSLSESLRYEQWKDQSNYEENYGD